MVVDMSPPLDLSAPEPGTSLQELEESENTIAEIMSDNDLYFWLHPEVMEAGYQFDKRAAMGAGNPSEVPLRTFTPLSPVDPANDTGIPSQEVIDLDMSLEDPHPDSKAVSKDRADIHWNLDQLPVARTQLTSSCFLGAVPVPLSAFQGRDGSPVVSQKLMKILERPLSKYNGALSSSGFPASTYGSAGNMATIADSVDTSMAPTSDAQYHAGISADGDSVSKDEEDTDEDLANPRENSPKGQQFEQATNDENWDLYADP